MTTKTKEAVPPSTALAIDREIEYQAFGSSEKIRLSISIVRKWLAKPTKSGKTASDSDIMKFIMVSKARQLNPWEGDVFLIGYDSQNGPEFSLITAHQAFLKRAEINDQYDGMESGVIVTNDKGKLADLEGDFVPKGYVLQGGWANVYRSDRNVPMKKRLQLEVFKKNNQTWNNNSAGMIVKCAEADALRASFPNTLGGLYTENEMQQSANDITNIPIDTTLPVPELITEEQRVALFDLAKEKGLEPQRLADLIKAEGFELAADITMDRYADIVTKITRPAETGKEDAGTATEQQASEKPAPNGAVKKAVDLATKLQKEYGIKIDELNSFLPDGCGKFGDMSTEQAVDVTPLLAELLNTKVQEAKEAKAAA